MKKFTKISMILCGILAGVGILLGIIGGSLGFGLGQLIGMAERGAFSIGWSDSGFYWGHSIWEDLDDLEDLEDLESMKDFDKAELIENSGSIQEWIEKQGGDWNYTGHAWSTAEVKNLNIDYIAGTLMIEPSDSDKIEVEVAVREKSSYNRSIQFELEGDTLNIKDNMRRRNLWMLRPGGQDAVMKIRIPAGTTFQEVKLDVGAAYMELGTDLNCQELALEIGAGQMITTAEQVSVRAEEMQLEVGAGEMCLDHVEAEKVEVDCGVGQMKIGYVKAVTANVECGVGQITLAMAGSENDYDYSVATGIGEVNVGSSSYGGLGTNKKVRNGGVNEIVIDCGVGSIDISFEK